MPLVLGGSSIAGSLFPQARSLRANKIVEWTLAASCSQSLLLRADEVIA